MSTTAARHAAAAAPPTGGRAFRADIQALRAVAVAGVVVYHLWPRALPGGFVGVDVFFVVSGFLITQQLVDEATESGRISLTQFWARRIRRILPAALVVLAAAAAAVVLLVPRVAWHDNLPDIRASAAYVENWQLASRAVDYLAAEADPSLVQHYWSLSVEEQFYLVWPLLLLFAVGLARRLPGRDPRAWPAAVLAAAGLSSFVLSVLWTASDARTAFFATPTRAWEFAAGGLAATLVPAAGWTGGERVRAATGAAGFAVVLAALALISSDQPFPGTIALVPVLGATLVVAAGLPARGAGRLVGLAPVQWMGDCSYAIYLWHWPLLVALPWVVHHEADGPDLVAVLVATLALAALTKVAVEDPVRRGRTWRSRTWLTYAIPVVGVSVLVAATTVVTDRAQTEQARAAATERANADRQIQALVAAPAPKAGRTTAPRPRSCFGAAAMDPADRCPHPFARPASLDPAVAESDGPTDPCLQKADVASPTYCTLGRTTHPARTIAVVGNSHAWRLLPALELYADQHGWKILVAVRINCLGLVTSADQGPSRNCLTWSSAVQHRLLTLHGLDGVIFVGYSYADAFTVGTHPTAAGVRARNAQVLRLWSALAARGTRVMVTEDVPGMRPTNDPECIARSSADDDPCAVDRSSALKADPIADLARVHPRLASYLPLHQYFCDARRCHGLIGGVVVYFDSHHLTTTYSRSLARYLGDAVAAALTAR